MNRSLSPLRLGLVAAALAILPGQLLAAGSDQITPEGMAQVAALVREKEARTPAQRKIDSNLLYEMKMRRGERIAQGVETQATGLTVDESGGTAVEIRADVTDGLLKELSAVGATVVHVSGPYRTVVASVPLAALEGLAARPDVLFILPHFPANTWQNQAARPASRQDDVARPSFALRAQRVRDFLGDVLVDPPSLPQVGSQNSQGDTTHQANTARSTIGPNGSGIKIGVLSNGVVSLAQSQALGDLGPVTVLPGQTGTGDEGTAMLEIVHDLAPQAQLYFATANPSISQFAQNVRDLRTAGCDIIIDDVFYFVETPFQDGQAPSVVSTTNGGAVIQAVNDVVAAGAMYFSSAGNQGNLDDGTSSCYQGDWADGGTLTGAVGGNVHNFGGGAQSDLIQTGSGNAINLYWADPLGGSANDYDLYVFNNALTAVVASSTNIQNGTQDPFEQTAGNTTNNRVVVLKKTAAAIRFFHITINANGAGHLAVSTEGTTKGHSMAAGAFSVGATPATAPGPFPGAHTAVNLTETFTSDGPRRIFFNADGTAITPGNFTSTGGLVRQKPDITAADKVSVTGVGGFPTTFSGTSAAAPHAGAIAALLKSGLPAPTNAQIRTALTSTAIDIETAGVDRNTGAGIVMPLPAMASLGIVAQAALDRGAFTVAELAGNGDGDGNVEKGETGTLVISLVNNGLAPATGVTATLTTTSPGVTIVPPTNVALPYADLATGGGTASNATPYQFQLGAAYTCSAPVDFVLTVTYNDGSARSKVLAFQASLATGFEVTTTLDATAPPASPSYTPTTGTQTNRVFRDGNGSSCGASKVFPGLSAATTPRFDAYSFVATSTGCNIVTLTAGPAGATLNFAVVYSGSFNPASLGTNYLADAGLSPSTNGQIPFGFNATAGQTYVVVVSEVPGGTAMPYTVKVNGTSLTTCNFAAQADLAITKTDGVTTAVPGGGVTYTITASNAGPNMAVGATVADTFPGILGVTWTCVGAGGGTCTAAGAGNVNDLVNLPSGGSVTYTAIASISAAATGTLSNTATVAAPGGVTDPVLGNNSATDTDTLTPQANLGITKTDGVTTAAPGGSVTYTITASNAGPSAAPGATVADTFPGSLIANWTCVGAGGGTCTAAGAGNINDVVNLPAGGSVTYTATATISAAATGTLSNTATVTAPGGVTDPTPANNSATDTDTLTPQANLGITKTDGVTTAIPGGSVTYTITASNAGPSNATGATVADTFPASLTATWTCVGAGGGTCSAAGAGTINDVVNLPAGGSVTYTASATINAAATGTLSNTATVTAPGGVTDPTPGNNSATDSDTLTPQANLGITKTDGVTTAVPGGSVTYTITASNAGPSNATGATVADTFPASLTSTWTCVGAGGGTCTAAGAGNVNDVVNLPVGGSVTYTATATISAAATGTLSNTATAAVPAGATDPVPGNNSATDTDTLTPQANLGITKTDGVTTAAPGGSVTYTITASNAGPSNATGATVADTFPASLTVTWTCVGAGGGTCTAAGAGNINDAVNLPAGGSVTYTASATISAAATGTLSNTATVAAPAGVTDPTPGNNSATDTDTLTPQADLAITKTDGVTTANPGGSVTYTIVASNAGPSNATGATVADTFPASLTATWTCVGAGGGTCTAAGGGNINDVVNLPSGGSVTYTASATISAAATGTLSNTATVAAPAGVTDPTPGNNSATDTDTLVAVTNADLSIAKTDGLTFYYPGQTVTYTIVVGNAGPAAATAATVADTLPADLTGATWTCAASAGSACGAPSGTGNINTTVDLPLGGTVTFTLTATTSPTATGSIVNTATVAAPGGVIDPTLGNNTTTDTDARKGGSYHTVTPCRVLDTRDTAGGPYGAPALTPTPRPFLIAGLCGVPANATAVAVNLTVTNGTTAGFVVASPTGGVLPPVSTINYGAGQTRANNAVVSLGSGGQLSLTASGTVDAILDVAGYFVE